MRPAEWQPVRTGLQQVRDALLSIMALLVSVVCAVILYIAVVAGFALNGLGNRELVPVPTVTVDDPAPVPTNTAGEECVGEELPPGC